MSQWYKEQAEWHAKTGARWQAEANSWLEWTLGRLAGTRRFSMAVAAFHRNAAEGYSLLAEGHGTGNEADKFERMVDRCMQHQMYGPEACKDMITRVSV